MATRLVRARGLTAAAVAAEDAARRGAEPDEKSAEGTEANPVGIAPLGVDVLVVEAGLDDAEEHHIDDPYDKGDEKCKTREQRHEDGPYAVVARATQAEEEGKARDAGSCVGISTVHRWEGGEVRTDRVEDQHVGQVVDNIGVDFASARGRSVWR